ncbi:ABC transporter permease [Halothermothrix orenii]|uniref:Binding-protein-dependent transport systems inner membrane component n=1 Tax=Halothermothrix orenii (strain H 168 / OCM 544 / DSM 9562) TaxID=373903 RepID=B8CXN8_HALOH|nr:binding-protein-dependent transport systems inner membrane component [Halothermothrix orenii H 168]
MYGRYVVKRIIYGIIIYVVIIFVLSILFNTVMETTLRSQIEERIQGEFMSRDMARLSHEEVQQLKQQRREELYNMYHLNEPYIYRVFWRAYDTITFDFGRSTHIKSNAGEREVFTIVMEKLPRTALLFTVAAFINVIISILVGLKKAQKAGGLMDQSTSILTMVVWGMPTWWLGMILIMLFAYVIPIFPSGGIHSTPPPEGGLAYFFDMLYHMTLPLLTLVLIRVWGGTYLTRNIVLGTLQQDYIMSARARGISEKRVLYGHALRSAAPPIATMSVISLLRSFAGAIIFEGIFSWPGMGNLYWVALQQHDIPVLMGNLSVTILLYLAGLVVLDLIYGFLDPRIKVGGKE